MLNRQCVYGWWPRIELYVQLLYLLLYKDKAKEPVLSPERKQEVKMWPAVY